MTEAVQVALIYAVQGITVALLGAVAVRLGKVRRDAAAVRDQVVNDHYDDDGKPIIMRDENDRRHNETKGWFAELRRDIGGIRRDIRDLGGRVQLLEQLEITQPRQRKDQHD